MLKSTVGKTTFLIFFFFILIVGNSDDPDHCILAIFAAYIYDVKLQQKLRTRMHKMSDLSYSRFPLTCLKPQ